MRKIVLIVASLALILVTDTFALSNIDKMTSSVQIKLPTSGDVCKGMQIGVNYNPSSMYAISNEIIHRDFFRFRQDGIDTISLSLFWFRLEGNTRGDYDGVYNDGTPYGKSFLMHVKRFIQIANSYDLQVMLTFHTGWDNEWCTPDYVIDPETGKNVEHAIVKSEDMKQAFLDMVNHTITYLRDENIWAWALLKEPWGKDYVPSFVDLIQRAASIAKLIDNRPVTVKFVNSHTWVSQDGTLKIMNHFTTLWNWDPRIFDALDFISFNAFIPKEPHLYDAWVDITMENVGGAFERSKNVWVTEFGFESDDDDDQATHYRKALEVFNRLPINGYIAWVWNQQPSLQQENGHNILGDPEGTPRKAYYEML